MHHNFSEQYPYLVSTMHHSDDHEATIKEINSKELILPSRFDLMAKLLFLDGINQKIDTYKGTHIYKAHLQSFGGGTIREPGNPDKKSLENFIDVFLAIYHELKELPLNSTICTSKPVPVDMNYMLLDGSHRCSCAFDLHHTICVYHLHHYHFLYRYDYYFFRNRFLQLSILLEMAKKYVQVKETALYVIAFKQTFFISKYMVEYRIRNKLQPVITWFDQNQLYLITDQSITSNDEIIELIEDSKLMLLSKTAETKQIQNIIDLYLAKAIIYDRRFFILYRIGLFFLYCYTTLLNAVKLIMKKPVIRKRK